MTYTHVFRRCVPYFHTTPSWAIPKTPGSRKGHPQICKGTIAYFVFLQFPETDVHPENMFNIAVVFAVAQLITGWWPGDPGVGYKPPYQPVSKWRVSCPYHVPIIFPKTFPFTPRYGFFPLSHDLPISHYLPHFCHIFIYFPYNTHNPITSQEQSIQIPFKNPLIPSVLSVKTIHSLYYTHITPIFFLITPIFSTISRNLPYLRRFLS